MNEEQDNKEAAVVLTGPSVAEVAATFDTVAAAENASVMEVRAPDGEVVRWPDGRPWTIKLRGKDCQAFQDAARRQQDLRVSAQIRTRAATPIASIQKGDIELLVLLTESWDVGFPGLEKSTPQNYRTAYTKYPALKEQVDEYTGVRTNFTIGSSAT